MELKQLHTEDNELVIGFGESRIGGRLENQDSYGALMTRHGFLVTVCDGMGGGPGGKTASTIAVQEIVAALEESEPEENQELTEFISKAICKANQTIWQKSQKFPQLRGMGTTATVLLITEEAAFAAHVGDSRVYQLRRNSKIFRTEDHSVVAQLVRSKVLSEEQARLSAQSNIITKALGIYPEVEVDCVTLPYEKGDRFLLCSDGVHGSMPEKELLKLVTSRKNVLGAIVDDVATIVDNLGRKSGGGHDNLTLAIIETKKNSILKTKMSKRIKFILSTLTAICALSIILNVVQGTNMEKNDSNDIVADSISALKQKISACNDTIKELTDSIVLLKKQNNLNSPKGQKPNEPEK